MKARFPESRGWTLGKSEQPLKRAIDARPSRNDLQTKQVNVFIQNPANLVQREIKPRDLCAGFSMLHIEFEFRTVVLTWDMAQRSCRVNGEKLVSWFFKLHSSLPHAIHRYARFTE